MTGRWSLYSLMLPANVLGSSPTAIAVADVRQRIYGHFPDVDVVKLSWRTKPLEAQIPVRWLARKIHNWSAKKIFSKRKDLPSSRDFYNSWIDVTVLQNEGFFEFREVICKCIPKASRMAIKRPKTWILRVFLRLFMKDSRSTCLRFGFGPDGNLLVSKSDVLQGELRRSCRIYSPYSSFQAILQKWETRPGRPGKEFRNGNEFARECLLWCEDQPQRYDLISWTEKKKCAIFLQVGSLQPVQWVLDDPMGSRIQFAGFQRKAPACRGRGLPIKILRWIFFSLQQKVFAFRRSSRRNLVELQIYVGNSSHWRLLIESSKVPWPWSNGTDGLPAVVRKWPPFWWWLLIAVGKGAGCVGDVPGSGIFKQCLYKSKCD